MDVDADTHPFPPPQLRDSKSLDVAAILDSVNSSEPLPALSEVIGSPSSKQKPLMYPLRDDSPRPPRASTSMNSRPVTPLTQMGDPTAGPSVQRSPVVDPSKQPLNVSDALGYLDAVKVQFQDAPEVYNRFLDIMKDFKGQVIDTPGVIQRVSRLFNGNPILIQGFNTFLPVGYRIETSTDPSDPNTITVTTPSGTTTQNTNLPQPGRNMRDIPGFGPNIAQPFPGTLPPPLLPPLSSAPISRSHTPHTPAPYQLAHGPPHLEAPYSPGFQNTQTAASLLGNLNNKNPAEKQPNPEFNHAIHYLNKIKARFSDDTNTYKQFLDILQTYQKEQRHVQDSQVYVQVQLLFKDAPDLLVEFKNFLPEAVGGAVASGGHTILPQQAAPVASGSQQWNPPEAPAAVDKSKKSSQSLKRRKKVVEKEPTPVPVVKPTPSRSKKAKHHHRAEPASPTFSPYVGPPSPPPASGHIHSGAPLKASSSQYSLHAQSSHGTGHMTATTPDKLLFFDRAKKSLENLEIYEEFLKLLSVFSRDIIDIKTLIERARAFLGDGDLMAEFKDLVGWDTRLDNVENGPPGSIRTGPPEALSALPADDGQGPSYRKLPDSEVGLACSGRDELCRSVLNDEWVSHPTWASEEAGFATHKKTAFEDALHKSEEERHEYHVHIEALARTLAVLEPIIYRIEEMNSEERLAFKLKADFGGSSKCLYHRVIKKVYGRDHGLEVIQALQDCPSVAVPVVFSRLKQKDEEWRRAQREWSRTWREVDAKNFHKSLDPTGVGNFKANDKKNITAKHFVADIEAVKTQQTEARDKDGIPSFSRSSVGFQLEYSFQDTSVLHDSLKMVYSFLDRSHVQYSVQERRSVERFLRAFVPLLFMYPVTEFNAACGPQELIPDDETGHESSIGLTENTRSGRRSIGSTHSTTFNGVAAGDLRKKLLRTAQEKADQGGSLSGSRAASPTLEQLPSPSTPSQHEEDDIWIKETSASSQAENLVHGSDIEQPFFTNLTFYTLLRLLQLLYSRLLRAKEAGQQLADEKHAHLLANPVAVELGLDDPAGPSTILASTMATSTDCASDDSNVVYMYLLDASEKVFAGELDQVSFEEHMRWFFGIKAYHLFTLDKLITALVKQVQTIISDSKCQELWTLLQSARNSEVISNQDIIRYRREADCHLGQDDHLYRLQWVRESKSIRVHLMGAEDPSVDAAKTAEDRWREYVDTYVLRHPTEWIPTKSRNTVFLRRTARLSGEYTAARMEGEMRIRIGRPSYKLVYEAGSEDVLWRKETQRSLVDRAGVREEERSRCRLLCA